MLTQKNCRWSRTSRSKKEVHNFYFDSRAVGRAADAMLKQTINTMVSAQKHLVAANGQAYTCHTRRRVHLAVDTGGAKGDTNTPLANGA